MDVYYLDLSQDFFFYMLYDTALRSNIVNYTASCHHFKCHHLKQTTKTTTKNQQSSCHSGKENNKKQLKQTFP